MVIEFFQDSSVANESEVEQFAPQSPEIVLALEAASINFLHLEIMPHELDAVMSEEEVNEAEVTNGVFLQQNVDEQYLQVGMMLLPDNIDLDPGLESQSMLYSSQQRADGVRLWAKHFAPLGMMSGIQIPNSWVDFFNIVLLNSQRFEWAKSLLTSGAWELVLKDKESEATLTFYLPQKCLSKEFPFCSGADSKIEPKPMALEDEVTPLSAQKMKPCSASSSSIPVKKRSSKAPLVVSEVRRSDRLKVKSKGYKGKSCKTNSCYCCSTSPPTLSTRLIKNLGREVCKIKPVSGIFHGEALQHKLVIKKATL
jgi:hypothetical protein